MQGRFVAREYVWIRVDTLSMLVYPLVMVALMTLVGEVALARGWLHGWYSSSYVVICALAANRVCVRAGLVCAAFSVMAHSYFFVAPRWAFEIPPPEQTLSYVSMFLVAYAVGRREPVKGPPHESILCRPKVALPFTAERSSSDDNAQRRIFWLVEPSGDWKDDTHIGSEYGRIYLEHARRTHRGPLLGWVVADMIRGGQFTGVEAGFLSVVGRAALGQSAPVPPREQEHAHDC